MSLRKGKNRDLKWKWKVLIFLQMACLAWTWWNRKFSSDWWQDWVTLLLKSGGKVTLKNTLTTDEKFKNLKRKRNNVSMKRSKSRLPINLLFRSFSHLRKQWAAQQMCLCFQNNICNNMVKLTDQCQNYVYKRKLQITDKKSKNTGRAQTSTKQLTSPHTVTYSCTIAYAQAAAMQGYIT